MSPASGRVRVSSKSFTYMVIHAYGTNKYNHTKRNTKIDNSRKAENASSVAMMYCSMLFRPQSGYGWSDHIARQPLEQGEMFTKDNTALWQVMN